MRSILLFALALLTHLGSLIAQDIPVTEPPAGIRDKSPASFALVGAKIVVAPGKEIAKGVIIVRDGVITEVRSDETVPADVWKIDASGKVIYPGLIDAYGETSAQSIAQQSAAAYWNSNIAPHVQAGLDLEAERETNTSLRQQGFTTRLLAPSSGIIKGYSILVATGTDLNKRAVLKEQVAHHMRLTLSFGGGGGTPGTPPGGQPAMPRDNYPNSPMGAVALARQALLDAQWYADAWKAVSADPTLPRPERSTALGALASVLAAQPLVIIDAQNHQAFLRADKFAREFNLKAAIRGSGEEYRRLNEIKATGRTIILPVRYTRPPDVSTLEAAREASLDQLLAWDFSPENPAKLDQAGVPIVFTSQGLQDRRQFLAAIRKAVRRGLSKESALKALTTTPAKLFGVDHMVGTIESGKMANLVVVEGDLFDDKGRIVEAMVDGTRYEMRKAPEKDIRGVWEFTTKDDTGAAVPLTVTMTGESMEQIRGKIRPSAAKAGDPNDVTLDGLTFQGGRLSASFSGKALGREGKAQASAAIEFPASGEPTVLGDLRWPSGVISPLEGKKTGAATSANEPASPSDQEQAPAEKPQGDRPAGGGSPGGGRGGRGRGGAGGQGGGGAASGEAADLKKDQKSSFPVNYPLGAWGRASAPEQPKLILFTNATIWTSGPAGKIEKGSLLVGEGKILAVGPDIATPTGATVVDLAGKHISAGIIDCHSHSATDGGVNESGQAITAEVRIGDFVDADDKSIYEQLAGGVTAVNVLHGSANPIGGQNQVLKYRWGSVSEDLKFREAPQGIKFALGENVKQSSSTSSTRYPQTRMGVEQLLRDEFQAAVEYKKRWEDWKATGKGLPPRKDLELEAIVEILEGRRLIHCHSYKQDEILSTLRVLEDFNIKIATLQHILEGYKVAEVMAKHGAGGSSFSDWWAYKIEVWDAIPFNGALMHGQGVVVSFNSDDRELARHLNHEAAKAVKYGGVPPEEALKFVTLNPAKQLRIDSMVGSLEIGKHADFAIWSTSPLSTMSRCEQTWVDGRKYFDRTEDAERRKEVERMRAVLVQKVTESGETAGTDGDGATLDDSCCWARCDVFCGVHKHTCNGCQIHQRASR
jgi:imidazolonepropionase-like amidohydrolase